MILNRQFKTVLQHDSKDCGPACLATVAKQYGAHIHISLLREYCGADDMGTSAYGLLKGARYIGFNAKGLYVDKKEDIFTDPILPAIAHIVTDNYLDHYVVIHKINSKFIIISDPAKGLIKKNIEDFFRLWTGFIILLEPNTHFSTTKRQDNFYSKFFTLLKSQKKILFFVFLFSVLTTFFGIAAAFYTQFAVDNVVPNNNSKLLTVISIVALCTVFLKCIFEGLRSLLIVYLGQRIDVSLLLGFYNHVIDLPMKFFSSRKAGEIFSRFNDATNIREAISSGFITLIMDSIMALAGSFFLYSVNEQLFKLTLIPLTIYFILILIFKEPIKKINRQFMEENARLTDYIIESIQAIQLVKSFNGEKDVKEKTKQNFYTFQKVVFKYALIGTMQSTLQIMLKAIFSIVILWIGINLVLNDSLTLGTLLAFNALLVYFLDPMERIFNLQSTIQEALVAADRVSEILVLPKEYSGENEEHTNLSFKKDIYFTDVSFRYGARALVLKNFTLNINAGQKIGIVGESGSGKTTLAKILMKFYPLEHGQVAIGNSNLDSINTKLLRDKIAYISQDTHFFSGTIMSNLRFANQSATNEEIRRVCEQTGILAFINKQPLQFNTILEDDGNNLSGGQRQKLSIARALLKKPDIIILDEATSNLDSLAEKEIMKVIYAIQDVTIIVIAHRLNTVKSCDHIVVLKEGQIESEGTHHSLTNENNFYASYWK